MSDDVTNRLRELNTEDFIWVIYLGIIFFSYVANHEEIPISNYKKFLNFVGFISLISFFLLHSFDLIAYAFAIYKDSNNVPFL